MSYLLAIVLTKIVFILVLLALRVKTFTLHLCLAGRIYWRFERSALKTPNKKETVYTVYAGPVAVVVVR